MQTGCFDEQQQRHGAYKIAVFFRSRSIRVPSDPLSFGFLIFTDFK